ncbi:MAG: DUF4956 domain-containing protein [Pseudomonadales bacterium]|nr:DUF4956 domain-containing protein [Pseudomonadales bacterium]
MKSARPLFQLTSYYLILFAITGGLIWAFPVLRDYLPIGGVEALGSGMEEFVTGKRTPLAWEPLEKSIRLGLALIGVVLLMEPVAWIYMGARRRRGREQSFVLTILLLPPVVAGIVIIVENSLALAFSLAGIVAGVRFRLTLDDTLDAIYIFIAIGAGLAAGIEALEIAAVVSIFFNYVVLLCWELDYAEEVSNNRWFTREWMNRGDTIEDTTSGSEKRDR